MKVNFAVIGTSAITEWFLEAAAKDKRFNLYAVYSRDYKKGEEFAQRYSNEVKVYDDLKEMLSDSNLQAVYIASPNSIHYYQAKEAINHNKAVICEKAFTTNLTQAKELVQLAREKKVLLMEAIRNTAIPNFKIIKDNLHKIGKVRRYSASFCQYSSRYDKYKKGEILNAFKRELSNGALMDIGVYCIHPMISLFGKPNEVSGKCTFLATGVDGQGTGTFKYDDMEGNVTFSKISNSYIPSEIQGEDGSIIISKITDMKDVKIIYRDGSEEVISIPQDETDMIYELKEFIDLYISGETESKVNSLDTTLEVMETMDLLRKEFPLEYPDDL